MLHYHVWFNLKPAVSEREGLAVIARFLAELCDHDEAIGYELLINQGEAPRSRLPRYHALVQFADQAHLSRAMGQQARRGIHTGRHGAVIEVVTDFHVEVFAVHEPNAGPGQ